VALIARGARRPASALRGLMQPFTPLLLSWFGKSELKTLHTAEWQGGLVAPQGRALMCGFYLNELLLRLMARGDAHELLYDRYVATLDQLAGETADFERILRRFEKSLLSEIGYGATFDVDADSGAPIEPEARYVFQPERGALRSVGQPGCPVSGQTLLDLAADRFERQATLVESKALMRTLINHTLGAKPLYTRQLLRELTDLNP
jgi:DNA repair protein RecO (recombination protein O)